MEGKNGTRGTARDSGVETGLGGWIRDRRGLFPAAAGSAGHAGGLHRGQELRSPDGTVRNVCLEREGARGKKIDIWHWRRNAFRDTREWNGLRVLMAVINNWDLKDQNTAMFQDGGERVYEISDLGATLARRDAVGRPRAARETWKPTNSHASFAKLRRPA